MTSPVVAPAAQTTPVHPGQLELFRVRMLPRIAIDYARPDGGPLTAADFDLLARLARTVTGPNGGLA